MRVAPLPFEIPARWMALLAYATAPFCLGFGPALVWAAHHGQDRWVARHAVRALALHVGSGMLAFSIELATRGVVAVVLAGRPDPVREVASWVVAAAGTSVAAAAWLVPAFVGLTVLWERRPVARRAPSSPTVCVSRRDRATCA